MAVDRALFDRYAVALDQNADMAVAELSAIMRGLAADASPTELARLLDELMPALAEKYGSRAAVAAVEFYRAQRDRADLAEPYEPRVYTSVDAGALRVGETLARFDAVGGDARPLVSALSGRLTRQVMGAADSTITANAAADPAHPRWAMVTRPGACGFCVMVSSNGWAYSTERAAARPRHDNCRCVAVADFDTKNPALDGYRPEAMQRAYADARETVRDATEREWAAMGATERARYARPGRSSHDVFMRNRVSAEMSRRDRGWLQNPDEPLEPAFATEGLLRDVLENRPHELVTARRLGEHGIRAVFQVDEEHYTDPKTGLDQKRGLPDLEGGWELKTLMSAASRNTVNGYLKNASKKGASSVVFDNVGNDEMDDGELEALLLRLPSFSRGKVYVLDKAGRLVLVR